LSHTDCERVLREIELYLDGELGSLERTLIHEHLEACGPCMDHAEFQQHVRELLKAKCGCDQMPDELLERIRSQFGEPTG
jgi:mycothiol system anti-sigma-R factor